MSPLPEIVKAPLRSRVQVRLSPQEPESTMSAAKTADAVPRQSVKHNASARLKRKIRFLMVVFLKK
jgi:hypothetical protein